MKKLFIILNILFFSFIACFLTQTSYGSSKEIQDELTQIEGFNRNKIVIKKEDIKDELLYNEEFDGNNLKIKIFKNGVVKKDIEDDFAKKVIDKTKVTIHKAKNHYNFAKKQIPIKIQIAKNFNLKNGAKEGDCLQFNTLDDVEINNKKFPKGTSIIGKIETISTSDKMGVPQSIVIDNFYLKDKPNINLYGYISKEGANRTIWVYPLYQAGNILLYVAGFVFVPIHGGHVKFSTNEIYTVYYENLSAI